MGMPLVDLDWIKGSNNGNNLIYVKGLEVKINWTIDIPFLFL